MVGVIVVLVMLMMLVMILIEVVISFFGFGVCLLDILFGFIISEY